MYGYRNFSRTDLFDLSFPLFVQLLDGLRKIRCFGVKNNTFRKLLLQLLHVRRVIAVVIKSSEVDVFQFSFGTQLLKKCGMILSFFVCTSIIFCVCEEMDIHNNRLKKFCCEFGCHRLQHPRKRMSIHGRNKQQTFKERITIESIKLTTYITQITCTKNGSSRARETNLNEFQMKFHSTDVEHVRNVTKIEWRRWPVACSGCELVNLVGEAPVPWLVRKKLRELNKIARLEIFLLRGVH